MRKNMTCKGCKNQVCDAFDWEQTGGEETNAIYERSRSKKDTDLVKIYLSDSLEGVSDLVELCRIALESCEYNGMHCQEIVARSLAFFAGAELDAMRAEVEKL